MRIINIRARNASANIMAGLERKGLIKVLKPTARVLNSRTRTGAVDVLYRSGRSSGCHCLLGIGKRNTTIEFSYHNEHEDLILLNPGKTKFKDLYLVLSFLKERRFLEALKKGTLSSGDFAAVRLKFNDPGTMFFTVLKGAVHSEVTAPGPGRHPVFFVSEPSGIKMNRVKTNKYEFCLV